jgi:serine/threonine protein phosphatase PrpC
MKNLHIDTYSITAKGPRPYQEDRYVVEQVCKNHLVMGVFDGHGGYQVAEMCAGESAKTLKDVLRTQPDVAIGIRMLFQRLDDKAKQYDSHTGCTAAVVVIKDEQVICANCGDAMILMKTTDGRVEWMSQDHKVENEKTRVEACGGIVTYGDGCARINMGLNIARSIGDHYVKHIVVSTPYVASCNVGKTHLDWIVIASDGLWDVYNKETFDFDFTMLLRMHYGNYEKAMEEIVDRAYRKGSMDNVTVVFVRFKYL